MAQAILLQDVEGLGSRGSVVDVSKGYLRNYLVPRKWAQPATKNSLEAAIEKIQAEERERVESRERARENTMLLNKTVLTIPQRASEDGRLYGSVGQQEIARAIRNARGIRIEKKRVLLSEPLRTTGSFMVEVEVSDGLKAAVKTIIVDQA